MATIFGGHPDYRLPLWNGVFAEKCKRFRNELRFGGVVLSRAVYFAGANWLESTVLLMEAIMRRYSGMGMRRLLCAAMARAFSPSP